MTQNKTRILLRRLVVFKGEHRAYDQEFHLGVNIIRSTDNTCGKTTIMDFIYYVLGGDIAEWSPEAASCDFVFGEFEFNNLKLTLKRKITINKRPDIGFYFGGFEDSLKDLTKWNDFPNARSEAKKSYSQLIFELLGYPEDKTTDGGNITIFELLRLIYCDQLTAVDEIFMKRDFDSAAVRRAIGEFLLGLDDFDLHSLRSILRRLESEYSDSKSKHRAAISFLAEANMPTSVLELKQIIAIKERESCEIQKQIADLENDSNLSTDAKVETNGEFQNVCSALASQKKLLGEKINKKEELAVDIEDSELFITSIQERLNAFKEARIAHNSLGDIEFDLCPACLAEIGQEEAAGKCRLCKGDLKIAEDTSPIFRVQFELEAQLRESEKLYSLKTAEFKKLDFEITMILAEIKNLEEDLKSFTATPDPIQASLKAAYKKMGRINEEFKRLLERQKLINSLEQMEEHLLELEEEINKSRMHILRLETGRAKRLEALEDRLSKIVVDILRRDLPGEENFNTAEKFEFSFEKDKMRVNGQKRFSASSLCFLKSAFYFAILKLSLENSNVRFPRFLLLDNIEDKGATPKRVQNMHKMLIEDLEDKDCQVIFTTSLLGEELQDSKYCVGPLYTPANKTLQLKPTLIEDFDGDEVIVI